MAFFEGSELETLFYIYNLHLKNTSGASTNQLEEAASQQYDQKIQHVLKMYDRQKAAS